MIDRETNQQVHAILTSQITNAYIQRSHIGSFAYPAPFHRFGSLSDYNRTSFEARPKPWSEWVGMRVLGQLQGKLSVEDINRLYIGPASERVDEFADTLLQVPLMLINGHQTYDLQAATSLVTVATAIGAAQPGRRGKNVRDIYAISHGVATVGVKPIMLGKRFGPHYKFMNMARWVVTPHLSFPRNARMSEAGLSDEFLAEYNARLREDCIVAAQAPTKHPLGFKSLWSMSPSGTPDIKNDSGEKVVPRVNSRTASLIQAMGVALLPVYTSFKKDNGKETVVQFGETVMPAQVEADTLATIAIAGAKFRRDQGERVRYELETA